MKHFLWDKDVPEEQAALCTGGDANAAFSLEVQAVGAGIGSPGFIYSGNSCLKTPKHFCVYNVVRLWSKVWGWGVRGYRSRHSNRACKLKRLRSQRGHSLTSQKVSIKLFCKSQLPYKSVNLFPLSVIMKDELTNLCEKWLSQQPRYTHFLWGKATRRCRAGNGHLEWGFQDFRTENSSSQGQMLVYLF